MRNLAFAFPGQGSQQPGMLAELAASEAVIEATFAEASAVLGEDLWEIAQQNENGRLDQTEITQPALLAASIALWRLWRQRNGALPALLAGHSLGEYAALVAAEVIEFGAAVAVTHKRGLFMQEAVPQGTGGIAAILGLDNSRLQGVCAEVGAAGQGMVSIANYNSPGQTVIAGQAGAVASAMAKCREAGAKRALPLKMSVPSHCSLMAPAQQRLAEELAALDFRTAKIPVVQNVNGQAHVDADTIRANLVEQLCYPVRWIDCIEFMGDAGIEQVLECGPGKVLAGLVKRISPQLAVWNSDRPELLDRALAEIGGSQLAT